ncbi:MAG: hypothetical protein QGG55_00960 [Verrucomicrobiota bacterium]|jgi:antitoxin component YwqK of YwqJK toxin-antitoxin module|nr:hypothetical protein [Verrucomicrobiota bacterium]
MKQLLLICAVVALVGCASSKVVDKNEVEWIQSVPSDPKDRHLFGKVVYKGKPFTGIVETRKNEKLIKREQFLNGDEHGLLEEYHDNGKIKVKAIVRTRARGGGSMTYNLERKDWDEQGKLTREVKAEKNGNVIYYMEDGKVEIDKR